MKITMRLECVDNEIRFFDACKAAAEVLVHMGQIAIETGDIDQFFGTEHSVTEPLDEEAIGSIKVARR